MSSCSCGCIMWRYSTCVGIKCHDVMSSLRLLDGVEAYWLISTRYRTMPMYVDSTPQKAIAPYEYLVHLAISMAASAASPLIMRRPSGAAPRLNKEAAAKLILRVPRVAQP